MANILAAAPAASPATPSKILQTLTVLLALLALLLGLASCGINSNNNGSGSAGSITLYSGRSEDLIAPVIERFESETNIKVNVRYGNSADLALLIHTEGANTPADVFISQSPGAIGFLNGNGHLRRLSAEVLGLVPVSSRPTDGTWVGITGRQRVLVYNPQLVDESELPNSVFELVDPSYRGRVGVAPQNSSFQDFITAMRSDMGDDVAQQWLAGMARNNLPSYPKNSAIVDAVIRGEVEMGLVNHYYLLRVLAEDPGASGVNHYFAPDDIGSLVIATGAAVLGESDAPEVAERLVEYLLSIEAQDYFAAVTKEYPLSDSASGIPPDLPALPELTTAALNWQDLGGGLLRTVDLIADSGIE